MKSKKQILKLLKQARQYEIASSKSLALQRHAISYSSQNGEDGMITEALRRLEIFEPRFVEIGASNGAENCTRHILENGGRGLWIEASQDLVNQAVNSYRNLPIDIQQQFVDRENIVDTIVLSKRIREGFDLLVVDIDGNDWHVLKEVLKKYKPSLVVAEYNPAWGPNKRWIMPYNPTHTWANDQNYGASLKSYDSLMRRNGYKLVACDPAGVNAFWVLDKNAHLFTERSIPQYHFAPASAHTFHRYPEDCLMDRPLTARELMSLEITGVDRLELRKFDMCAVVIELKNNSHKPISSFGKYPIRVGVTKESQSVDEPTRASLTKMILPEQKGLAHVMVTTDFHPEQVKIVQEGIGWSSTFHYKLK
jgi:hypothetical protein